MVAAQLGRDTESEAENAERNEVKARNEAIVLGVRWKKSKSFV